MNADLLAKKRGLRIVETVVPSDGAGVLDEIEVNCTAMHGDGEVLRRLRVLFRADGGALQLSANPSASVHPQVAIGSNKSKFSSAVTPAGRIAVAGTVKSGTPFLTRIGAFDVDLAVEVRCMCTRSAHIAPGCLLRAVSQCTACGPALQSSRTAAPLAPLPISLPPMPSPKRNLLQSVLCSSSNPPACRVRWCWCARTTSPVSLPQCRPSLPR